VGEANTILRRLSPPSNYTKDGEYFIKLSHITGINLRELRM
jgi:hypothetical protein